MRKYTKLIMLLMLFLFIISKAIYATNISNVATNNTTNSSIYDDEEYGDNDEAKVTTSNEQGAFGLSEYLNIAIIVIGTLIILLSIAILIRLKR